MKKISLKHLEIALLIILSIGILVFLWVKKYKSKGKIESTLAYCAPPYVPFLNTCILPAPVAPIRCDFCTIYNSTSRRCEPLVCPSGSFCIPQGASYKCSNAN